LTANPDELDLVLLIFFQDKARHVQSEKNAARRRTTTVAMAINMPASVPRAAVLAGK